LLILSPHKNDYDGTPREDFMPTFIQTVLRK